MRKLNHTFSISSHGMFLPDNVVLHLDLVWKVACWMRRRGRQGQSEAGHLDCYLEVTTAFGLMLDLEIYLWHTRGHSGLIIPAAEALRSISSPTAHPIGQASVWRRPQNFALMESPVTQLASPAHHTTRSRRCLTISRTSWCSAPSVITLVKFCTS